MDEEDPVPEVLAAPMGPSHNGEDLSDGAAVSDILETVLEFDADHCAKPTAKVAKVSPMITVFSNRAGGKMESHRVYKATYIRERQQYGVGQRIPSSRLEKITATAKATRAEYVRAARAVPTAEDASGETSKPDPIIKIGSNVVFAMESGGKFKWWADRVQKMKGKSNGKTGK